MEIIVEVCTGNRSKTINVLCLWVHGLKKGLRACAWKHLDREILAKIAKSCEPAHNLVS